MNLKRLVVIASIVLSLVAAAFAVAPVLAQGCHFETKVQRDTNKVSGEFLECGTQHKFQIQFVVTTPSLGAQPQPVELTAYRGFYFGPTYGKDGSIQVIGFLDGNIFRSETYYFGSWDVSQASFTSVAPQQIAVPTAQPISAQQGQGGGGSQASFDGYIGYLTPPEGAWVQIAVLKLNVRAESNTSSPILTTMPIGVYLPYKDVSPDGGWYRVDLGNGKEGWVWAAFTLRNGEPAQSVVSATNTPAPTMTATIVNVPYFGSSFAGIPVGSKFVFVPMDMDIYQKPSESFAPKARTTAGTYFVWRSEVGEWIEVVLPNFGTGFVHKADVKVGTSNGTEPIEQAAAAIAAAKTATPTLVPPTPETLAVVSMVCGISPTPQLLPGGVGHNAPDQGTTSVRLTPRGEIIHTLQPNDKFVILRGIVTFTWKGQEFKDVDATPRCLVSGTDESLIWYMIQVTLEGGSTVTGWAPEGTGKGGKPIYWLIPG